MWAVVVVVVVVVVVICPCLVVLVLVWSSWHSLPKQDPTTLVWGASVVAKSPNGFQTSSRGATCRLLLLFPRLGLVVVAVGGHLDTWSRVGEQEHRGI